MSKYIEDFRRAGPGRVRADLERLVNDDIITVKAADRIFSRAFGLRLKGVPAGPAPRRSWTLWQTYSVVVTVVWLATLGLALWRR